MINKIHTVAKNLLEKFEVKTSTDGKKIIICQPLTHLKSFIRQVHGELLPDDFIYKIIYDCIESVANGSECLDSVLEEIKADINVYNLTEWSVSNRLRIYLVNDTLNEYQGDNYVELLHLAQASEIESICDQTINYLEIISD